MLRFLRGTASARKLRLFACACYRRRGDLLAAREDREVVRLAELYADGRIGGRKMARAFMRAGWGYEGTSPEFRSINWSGDADEIARDCVRVFGGGCEAERAALCGLLREGCGDPFT